MSANDDLQQRLQAGIAAAKRGDRPAARRLLEAVIADDPNNEIAWIWLASTVTTLSERRTCLQKVLQINPNNARAKEALSRLEGRRQRDTEGSQQIDELRAFQQRREQTARPSATPPPPRTPETTSSGGFNLGPVLLLGAIVIVIVALGVIASSLFAPVPAADVTRIPTSSDTPAPSRTPRPTRTPVLVTPDRSNLQPLPPTFTPSATYTPTSTFTPSPTPFPLANFDVLYTARDGLQQYPSLYRMQGNGEGESLIMDDVQDITYDHSGNLIAFAREVTYAPDEEFPEETTVLEIFIGPAQDPAAAEQVTDLRIRNAYSPAISPNGELIVYVSDWDDDEDLWLLDLGSGVNTQLTFNEAIDRDPHWSPDGQTIVYASDQDSPGFTEIYALTFGTGEAAENQITRLTDNPGSSYAPHWSPDGQWIVYVGDQGTEGDIYLMDAQGQRPSQVTFDDGDAEDRAPGFTPDGRFISFISNREDGIFQGYLITWDGDELLRVTENDFNIEALRYRPSPRYRVN